MRLGSGWLWLLLRDEDCGLRWDEEAGRQYGYGEWLQIKVAG
jgi:hypothetical protein